MTRMAGQAPIVRDARGDANLVRPWTLAFVVGELAGFIPPAVVGVTLGMLAAPDFAFVMFLTLAGVAEGAVLGAAQAWVLRRYAPGIDSRQWITATAAAAGFAWFIGMGTSVIGGSSTAPAWALIVLLAPLWVMALVGMGLAQWMVLKQTVPRSARWIWVTAAAWLVGVTIPIVALSAVPDGWPMWTHGVIGLAAAVAMGLTVGGLTGRTLTRLLRNPAHT